MSILIKGMEMPKNCYECQFAASYFRPTHTSGRKPCSFACVLTQKALTSTKRNRFCPLVPVPKHGRLIEERRVLDIVYEWCPDDDGSVGKDGDLREMLDEIEAIPTIIEAEGE